MSKTMSKVAGLIGSEGVQKLSKAGIVCLTEHEYEALQQQRLDHLASRLERELAQERRDGADISVFASVIYRYLENWVDRRFEYKELMGKGSNEAGYRLAAAERQLVETFNACRRYENEKVGLRYASPRISPLQRLLPHLRSWLDVAALSFVTMTAEEQLLYTLGLEIVRQHARETAPNGS